MTAGWDKPEGRELWYTIGELAAFLNKSVITLERWLNKGKIPQPLERTPHGFRLWSPLQATQCLEVASRKRRVRQVPGRRA